MSAYSVTQHSSLRTAGAVFGYPGKGHDRLFMDAEQQFFAAIDGAGGAELSQAIAVRLPDSITEHSHIRQRSQREFLARVAADLDNLPEGRQRKATAALACIADYGDKQAVAFANFGDSSLWLYQPDSGISQLAHDPTSHVVRHGRTYIDTSEFLGARRPAVRISAKVGSLVLAPDKPWSVIGMSDGVYDDDGQGVSEQTLSRLAHMSDPTELSKQLIGSYIPYDDASVFVITKGHPA